MLRDKVPPPLPPAPLGREVAVDPLLVEKRVLMRELKKHNPPSFSRDQGPLVVEDWL